MFILDNYQESANTLNVLYDRLSLKTTKPFTRNHKTVYLKNDEYLTLHFNHDDFSPIIHRLKQKVI